MKKCYAKHGVNYQTECKDIVHHYMEATKVCQRLGCVFPTGGTCLHHTRSTDVTDATDLVRFNESTSDSITLRHMQAVQLNWADARAWKDGTYG